MAEKHNHRDFRCPECGELVTCLSCLEVHAGTLPRGPAFAVTVQTPTDSPVFETIGVTNAFDIIEPGATNLHPPPAAAPQTQQSLFA